MIGHFARILVIFGLIGGALAGQPQEIADSIRAIRSVGPEGRGNAAAAAAWKKLAAGDATILMPILEGMDDANDLALNWLRAAVDSVTGRVLGAGGSLPLHDLGMFLLDTRHNPRARRLDFELLTRIDAATADKLLAGMLNDPSTEIRYDAVQKVIHQAGQSLAASNKVGATLLFQQALNSARDARQIDDIAQQLGKLGQPVDTLKLFGFLTEWKIIGPFDNRGRKGFDAVYPPEQKIDLAAEYEGNAGKVKWRDYVVTQKYGKVDMNQPYGKLKDVTAYAMADFFSDRAQSVELRLGGKNSWKVWLNSNLLFGRDEYHFNSEIDQYPMPAQLQAGRNTILVKVCQNEQTEEWTVEWDFQLRVTDALGTPILSTATGRDTSTSIERP
jgi:murein DD-endopeptidase MepM/ murein hydrolase activator NlpD